MRKSGSIVWLLILVVLAIGVVLGAAEFLWWSKHRGAVLCHAIAANGAKSLDRLDGWVGCAEFWFARYQTLIGAVVAIGVAIATVTPLFRQLRAMRLQVASGSIDALDRRALVQQAQIDRIRSAGEIQIAITRMRLDFGLAWKHSGALHLFTAILELSARLRSVRGALEDIANAYPPGDAISRALRTAVARLDETEASNERLNATVHPYAVPGVHYFNDLTEPPFASELGNLAKTAGEFQKALDAVEALQVERIRALHQKAHSLEREIFER